MTANTRSMYSKQPGIRFCIDISSWLADECNEICRLGARELSYFQALLTCFGQAFLINDTAVYTISKRFTCMSLTGCLRSKNFNLRLFRSASGNLATTEFSVALKLTGTKRFRSEEFCRRLKKQDDTPQLIFYH